MLFDLIFNPKSAPSLWFLVLIFLRYIYIYTKIKKPKTRCVRENIKQKNTFSILTNISFVLHNLLQCYEVEGYVKESKYLRN